MGGIKRRLVVVWSSPYLGSNELAVGFTTEGGIEKHDDKWYKTIIKHENGFSLEYVLQVYKNGSNDIIIRDKNDKVEVKCQLEPVVNLK